MVRPFALALLLIPAGVKAGSAQGSLLVSVTVVSTCAAGTTAMSSVDVQCPQQQPFRVRLAPAAAVKRGFVDTGVAQTFSANGRVSLSAPGPSAAHAGSPAAAGGTAAVSSGDRAVTVLTVSY